MLFLINDEKLVEAYNRIWDKVSNLMRKWFIIEPLYDGNINKKSHDNRVPKEDSHCVYLSVLLRWLAWLMWNCFFKDWFCYNLIVLIK